MTNYIAINGQQIELTAEQVQKIQESFREKSARLSDKAVGDTVNIGSHEMIVLEQIDGATLLLRKDLLGEATRFGEDNNKYDGSYVDEACNEFAEEIAGVVGEENVLLHEVDLTSDDGLKDYGVIQRKASLLTAEQYRQHVQTLDKHKVDAWWWLATPHSTAAHGNDSWVKCVAPSGSVGSDFCNYGNDGVRPFCILKSDIFVSN